jgi:hypothetical protein
MPRVNIHIRNEDWEKWQLMVELGLVPEFLHRAIQRYKIPRDVIEDEETLDNEPFHYHEGKT